jgi:hypothetical protein
MGSLEKTFDLISPPNYKSSISPLDQQRASEQQAVVGAGQAEIVGRPRSGAIVGTSLARLLIRYNVTETGTTVDEL